MLATTLGAFLRPWRSPGMAVLVLTSSGAGAIAAWGYEGSIIGQQGLALYFFYLLGCVIGPSGLVTTLNRLPTKLAWPLGITLTAMGAMLAVGPASPPTSDSMARTLPSVTLGIIMTLVSTAGVLVLSKALQTLTLSSALAYLGRHSMTVFLAHIISIAGTRAVLLHLGIDDPVIMIPVQLAVGVAAPLLLHALSQRAHFSALIRAPQRLRGVEAKRVKRSSARTR